jgi:hypothetical protein
MENRIMKVLIYLVGCLATLGLMGCEEGHEHRHASPPYGGTSDESWRSYDRGGYDRYPGPYRYGDGYHYGPYPYRP